MAMASSEDLSLVSEFFTAAGKFAQLVNVVLCPPYTFLDPLSKTLTDTSIEMGSHPEMMGQKLVRKLGSISAQKVALPRNDEHGYVICLEKKQSLSWERIPNQNVTPIRQSEYCESTGIELFPFIRCFASSRAYQWRRI
jgi:hypothetical protein